VIIFNTI